MGTLPCGEAEGCVWRSGILDCKLKRCIVTLEQRNPGWTGFQEDLATMVAGLVGEGLGYGTETPDR